MSIEDRDGWSPSVETREWPRWAKAIAWFVAAAVAAAIAVAAIMAIQSGLFETLLSALL